MQRVLADYLERGGSLFVSGSYVASDLTTGPEAGEAERAFVREVLHCALEQEQTARRGDVRVVAPTLFRAGSMSSAPARRAAATASRPPMPCDPWESGRLP